MNTAFFFLRSHYFSHLIQTFEEFFCKQQRPKLEVSYSNSSFNILRNISKKADEDESTFIKDRLDN